MKAPRRVIWPLAVAGLASGIVAAIGARRWSMAPAGPEPPAGPRSVALTVTPQTVRIGQPYVVTGTGWTGNAPVTLGVGNAGGSVVVYLRGAADTAGSFSFTHALAEEGAWTISVYWQPDASAPPGSARASVPVTCVG